ncbi:NADPH-dependent FMN reductase [Streptomyces sp. NPDC059340]|uniref:NADPH-dependent FMN reductase n=1 Tax=Streptomyces sp. NPDC059340 TaxID=3346806 RepID=UPI003692B59C
MPARLAPGRRPHTRRWAERIGSCDALIVVTPEYNTAPPAALTNAIDYLYAEWGGKPVDYVGYGIFGAVMAVQKLRAQAGPLRMAEAPHPASPARRSRPRRRQDRERSSAARRAHPRADRGRTGSRADPERCPRRDPSAPRGRRRSSRAAGAGADQAFRHASHLPNAAPAVGQVGRRRRSCFSQTVSTGPHRVLACSSARTSRVPAADSEGHAQRSAAGSRASHESGSGGRGGRASGSCADGERCGVPREVRSPVPRTSSTPAQTRSPVAERLQLRKSRQRRPYADEQNLLKTNDGSYRLPTV